MILLLPSLGLTDSGGWRKGDAFIVGGLIVRD
jgi:hypothetical protein